MARSVAGLSTTAKLFKNKNSNLQMSVRGDQSERGPEMRLELRHAYYDAERDVLATAKLFVLY